MLEDLLERAEEQTRAGDRTKATALLRAAVDGATADLERKPTERTRAVRAVAAYQLATLLLQDSTTAKEGDALVWRLGFRLRLADEALRYDTTLSRPPRRAPNAPRVVDQALSDANLRSLAAVFGRDAPYWPAHEGSDGFYSYNVPLDDAGPLGGFLRALRPVAAVDAATSGEIWAHSREADGAHQLHYDLDEAALQQGVDIVPHDLGLELELMKENAVLDRRVRTGQARRMRIVEHRLLEALDESMKERQQRIKSEERAVQLSKALNRERAQRLHDLHQQSRISSELLAAMQREKAMEGRCFSAEDDAQSVARTCGLLETGMIANHMKKCFLNWNKDTVEDKLILDHLKELSNDELKVKSELLPLTETAFLLKVKSRNGNGPRNNNKQRKNNRNRKRF